MPDVYVDLSMNREVLLSKAKDEDDGDVFVKKTAKFMLSDDLRVMPMSTSTSISLMQSSGVEDESNLEERSLNLGVDEVKWERLTRLIGRLCACTFVYVFLMVFEFDFFVSGSAFAQVIVDF